MKKQAQSQIVKLDRFIEAASSQELGDLLLAKLNGSSISAQAFHQQVQKVLNQVLTLVDFAEQWAENEAQSRYVNYIRTARQLREGTIELTQESRALKGTKK